MIEGFIKTVHSTDTNLNDVEFKIEVDENYLQKDDEFRDLESGLEFIVVDRPYRTLQGKWELRVRILTKINSLKYLRNKLTAWVYDGEEV